MSNLEIERGTNTTHAKLNRNLQNKTQQNNMESSPQQTSEGKAVVAVLAAVLERLVNSNAHVPNGENVTKFHALKAPAISIKQYLERIHKYASCSTECFILALIYIDRLIQRNNFILSELNVHRVCVTAILLAAKFFDDAYYNNAYYAKVGGVLISEMNGLEVEFLFRINFSLHVTPEVFVKYQDELISHAIGAGLERPAEMAVSSCVQPIAPAEPMAVHMNVPIPVAPPATAAVDVTMQHNRPIWDMKPQNGLQMDQQPQEHQQQLYHKIHPQQLWTGTVHTATSVEQAQMPTHITPSPPHAQHRQTQSLEFESCNSSQYTISPALSAPGALHHNHSSVDAHQPLVSDNHSNTRPRYNSFPIDAFPMVSHNNHNPVAVTQYTTQQKPRIHQPSEVHVACHFGITPTGPPQHFVSASRGVYQQ